MSPLGPATAPVGEVKVIPSFLPHCLNPDRLARRVELVEMEVQGVGLEQFRVTFKCVSSAN